jgi:hypothetical protein
VKSNCVIFALQRWFSLGGYIALRKSNYGWWPHMIWTKDLVTFEEFTPAVHCVQAFPPLLFNGTVKITNREEQVARGRLGLGLAAAAIAGRATDLTRLVKTARHTTTEVNDAVLRASEIMATTLCTAAPLIAGTARKLTAVGDTFKPKPGPFQRLSKTEWLKVRRRKTISRSAGRSSHGNLRVCDYRSPRGRSRRPDYSPLEQSPRPLRHTLVPLSPWTPEGQIWTSCPESEVRQLKFASAKR